MTCTVTTATSYGVELGDGDDRLTFGGAAADAMLRGGAGNDEITSGRTKPGRFAMFGDAGDDHLVSGPLDEELYGGAGNDALEGGEGSDRLWGNAGADRMDGGPGEFDSVEYGNRRTDVRVDLGKGTSGAAGEGDTIASVEAAVTGSGDDLLIGNDVANELISGRGRDRIEARGGDDQITTGKGARSIGCGAGRDQARTTGPEAVIGPDCELASGVDLVPAPAQPVIRTGVAIVSVRVVERRRTRGTVVLTAGPNGPVLGTGDAAQAFRRSVLARVRVTLTPAGRAYLRRPRGKLLTVTARLRDADGPLTNRWTIRLR
jgi:Ca2+-binding RTX toxin-like protein